MLVKPNASPELWLEIVDKNAHLLDEVNAIYLNEYSWCRHSLYFVFSTDSTQKLKSCRRIANKECSCSWAVIDVLMSSNGIANAQWVIFLQDVRMVLLQMHMEAATRAMKEQEAVRAFKCVAIPHLLVF